jgi:glycosyltransferase involved in cell wall biosynthesis
VFTVSETSKHDIHEHYGYPLERIRVVPNGVDPRVFRPDAHRTRSPFLLTVGAACAHKNVHEILQRGRLWRDRYQLVVASARGPYRQELERIVRRERLESKVRFISYATPAELLELYQSCAAMVTASKWEGFGIPLLEAMACGARVIASDIPAHREVLAGHERLVRLGDEASWADAFTWLERVAPAARNARVMGPVERYSWERSGRLLVSHLLEVEPSLAHSLKMKWTHTIGSVA